MNDLEWMCEHVEKLTDEKLQKLVSEWAVNRYMPPELTGKPGYWDNDYAPHLTEIMDCLSASSPVRKVAFMKPTQIGATTGIIENFAGYTIEHDPAGMMYISADRELTKMSIEVKLDRMLLSCGLSHKIKTADENSRKTGNTSSKKEFPGGFLLAVGARNPGKLRSMSVKKMLMDEVDGMPEKLGDEGDPVKIAENRTKAFERTRKIVYLSTPTIMQTSRIYALYLKGDQRRRYVPCKKCGHMQELVFLGRKTGGERYGLMFDVDGMGNLIEESVRYRCVNCDDEWREHDKSWFLKRGEWRPTATAREQGFRSYAINSLYAPFGMYSWKAMVYEYLDVFDALTDRVKDFEGYKTFVNTALGMPWEERGEAPKFETVVQHRRAFYSRNEIKNSVILHETGAPLQIVTAAADVHKDRIDVEILGWARDGRSYSIDWRHLEGDTADLYSRSGCWQLLRDIVERGTWKADTGELYLIQVTLIDASYRTDEVYTFAAEYSAGVFPVMGRDSPIKNAKMREFAEYTSKAGTRAFNINTTLYKDRLASWLRRDWNSGEPQPIGYPNYPQDYGDDYFREYEAESKVEKLHSKTHQRLGFFWQKLPNKPNHAWDVRVYNMAALDIIALSVCETELEIEGINYTLFWDHVIKEKKYLTA